MHWVGHTYRSLDTEQAEQSVCHFFQLLPEDLQLLVLQPWLADNHDDKSMLLHLSRLDIACCNRSLRRAYLGLSSHPGLKWPKVVKYLDKKSVSLPIKDMLCYMKWLHVRQVAVCGLVFTHRCLQTLQQTRSLLPWSRQAIIEQFTLPSIQHVSVHLYKHIQAVKFVLSRCPAVTSMECLDRGYCQLLPMLSYILPPGVRLKQMLLEHCWFGNIIELIGLLGNSLERLHIDQTVLHDDGIDALRYHCPNLRALHIGVLCASSANTISLVKSCKDMCELIFTDVDTVSSTDFVSTLIEAIHPQMKVFGWQEAPSGAPLLPLFIDSYPGLERIEMNWCPFHRAAKDLTVTCSDHTNEHPANIVDSTNALERLVVSCRPLSKLTVRIAASFASCSEQILKIGDAMESEMLTDLTIMNLHNYRFSQASNTHIALQCAHLTRLSFVDIDVCVGDEELQQIAHCCRKLEYLHISHTSCNRVGPIASITDVGMEALIANCINLKVLHIHTTNAVAITSRTLQCMLDHQHLLQEFAWDGGGFSKDDVEAFRQAAREMQLLPVPVFKGGVSIVNADPLQPIGSAQSDKPCCVCS